MPVYTNYKERKEDINEAIKYYLENDTTQLECAKKYNLSPQIFEYYYNKHLISNRIKEGRKKHNTKTEKNEISEDSKNTAE